MTTILDALHKGTGYFEKHGVESARLNMQHLLAHVLGCPRMQLYVDFDKPMDEDTLGKLRGLMRDRAAGKPLQHLLGTVEFHGHEFLSDQRALIPRPETEQLVEILGRMEWPPSPRILDMGCGSGVIGLSLAGLLQDLQPQVVLADISPDALALARQNQERLPEETRKLEFTLVESDLFSSVEGRFDLIAANLPYLPDADMSALQAEVQHDPELALRGGPAGTEIMERFLSQAPAFLNDKGQIAMEFGLGQEDALTEAAARAGFTGIQIQKDYDDHPRFLFARTG